MKSISPYVIPPVLSLLTAYSLAAMAIFRGKFKTENLLLAVVCISWTLTSGVFVCHYFIMDEELLLRIERGVHTFYVFMPAVSVLFYQVLTGMKNRAVTFIFFAAALALSVSVQTDYYFYGLYTYEWGRIAKGGTAFRVFAGYGVVATCYIIYVFYKRLISEKNRVLRTKLYYLFIAYFLTVTLTFTCLPAMHGYDIYPLATYVFIPVGILTYGILRYRVMDISRVLHISIFWLILSSIIVVPNIVLFVLLREYFFSFSVFRLTVIFVVWFLLNYIYFIRIQPLIDQVFNRLNRNLKNFEALFNRELSQLMGLDDFALDFTSLLRRSLNLNSARLFCRRTYQNNYTDFTGQSFEIDHEMQMVILDHPFLEKSLIELTAEMNDKEKILLLFHITDSEYIVPMVHRDELIALLCLSQRKDQRRLNDREFRFITRLNRYASIAIANSVIYQDLSDMKDNLEKIVRERTSIIEKQKHEMESDIELARKIQTALLPSSIPYITRVDIAYRYVPVMKVGGDFIDIHYREGMNELGLFICDVSGHGAASAMIASMVKMSLNSWGKFITSPGKAFVEMRNMLYGKIGDNFITACMCCIDLNTGEVISANAGHPPMLIVRTSGEIEVINSWGKIIVDYAASDYEERRSFLGKGDKLVLYTDGVIEARNINWEYGEERFYRIIRENINQTADELCRLIYEGVALDGGVSSLNDDFALLIAEYRGD